MSKINELKYEFFNNKKINIYYSDLNKLDILYLFVKNIFIYNVDFYINKIIEDIFNKRYPFFKINKKEINITNNNIKIDFECLYENNIISIDKNININNNVFLEDNLLKINLPLSVNDKIHYWKHEFINFNFSYINEYFDYDFVFFKKDIFELYFENLKYDFSLYDVIPNKINLSKKIVDKKLGINIKYSSYNFENEIQKFEIVYSGDLFIELKTIDLLIKKNNIEFETNIFTLDKTSIENIMYIGDSIKKLKYSIEIKKDFFKNIAYVIFKLNNIDKNLYYFNEIKNIQNIFEIEINYNFSNISKIDIEEYKKSNLLPVNILPNDIDIFLTNNLYNLTIISKKIISFNNSKGLLSVLIKYSYKNIFGIETFNEIIYDINDLCSFNIKDKNKLLNYIKKNFFKLDEFDFYKFKNSFLKNNLDWFIELNRTYINKKTIDMKYKNNILYIDFYIENINGEILDKCSVVLNLETKKNTTNNKNNINKKTLIIVLATIGILILILSILFFVYRKIKIKKQNIIK